ncbi:hypothetical protein [Burkholderia sp. SCN-KJ]|uniref:hypothetical protein n=1 Tax=Burkholderia sp. SCN-KJ TaxID=2969248 RepID=UPI0021503577|nr:hypothetical protein [Burkholderia sp. SCN-KJ]MCR4466787.1 hypothetical protein [Burkholderia sp. SCN-KJ]
MREAVPRAARQHPEKRIFSATGRDAANNDSRFAYRAAPAARTLRTSRAAR